MFRAVLFDLDGTLYDRDLALHAFARAQFDRLQLGVSGMTPQGYVDRFVELDNRGKVWKDKVYEVLAPETGGHHDATTMLADYNDRFGDHCEPFDGITEVLEGLTAAGVKIGLVTNGLTTFQGATFRALGLGRFFHASAISEEVGYRKPDPRHFQCVLSSLGVEAADAVFVGDDPTADIEGAKAAGMRAIWVESDHHPRPPLADATVRRMRDLPEILRSLSEPTVAAQ